MSPLTANAASAEAGERAGALLLRAIEHLAVSQLPGGEMPAYERLGPEDRFYWPTPLFSAWVYEALGALDQESPHLQPAVYELLPPSRRRPAAESVTRIRRRLRGLVAFHQEADGTWGLHGRGSGNGADPTTTFCCALALWGDGREPVDGARRTRLRSAVGRLSQTASNPLAEAYALCCAARLGLDATASAERVLRRAETWPEEAARADPTSWLIFARAAARAWGGRNPGFADDLRGAVVPRTLALELEAGGFGSPQRNALAASTLLDLEVTGPTAERAVAALWSPAGPWPTLEIYLSPAVGSPSLVSALAAAAVARGATVLGWRAR